jgi:AraC-like DNA-binding protein
MYPEAFHQFHLFEERIPLIVLKSQNLAFRAHWHSEIEILYMLSGSLGVSVNQHRREIGPGSFVICGSRDIHYYEHLGIPSNSAIILFKPEMVGNQKGWPMSGRLRTNIVTPDEQPKLCERVKSIVDMLFLEMTKKAPGYVQFAQGGIFQLCGLVERDLMEVGEASAKDGARKATMERMQAVIDYIHEKAGYPISLEDVAGVASLSPCYFSRVFKTTTGMSFPAYVNEVRIARAENLMANSAATIADIALECGFENLRTFNRAYRQARSTAPSLARRDISVK